MATPNPLSPTPAPVRPGLPARPGIYGNLGYGRGTYGQRPQLGDGITIKHPKPGEPPVIGGQPYTPGGDQTETGIPGITIPALPPGFGGLPGFGDTIGQPGPGGGGQVKLPDYLTPPGASGPFQNPYAGIPGFENWGREQAIGDMNRPDFLRRHGMRENIGPYGQGMYVTPGKAGYPTRETVMGISQAMARDPYAPPMRGRGGFGADITSPDDLLKRMLAERMRG